MSLLQHHEASSHSLSPTSEMDEDKGDDLGEGDLPRWQRKFLTWQINEPPTFVELQWATIEFRIAPLREYITSLFLLIAFFLFFSP